MDSLVIARNEADAAAVAAVEQHHAAMAGTLTVLVDRLVAAVAGPQQATTAAAAAARRDLVTWCRDDLMPHAVAEEKAMYPAAHAMEAGRLLVDGMLEEHAVIGSLVDEVEAAGPVEAAAAAKALAVMFQSHLRKENELVVPLLAAAPDVSVAELLGGMHELLGGHGHEHGHEHGADEGHEHAHQRAESGCGGHCGCGEVDGPGHPELDARAVPHAIRHATIFGALDAVGEGGGLVLVAPHDPLPLLSQVDQRWPGRFEVSYLETGPEAWRLQLVRRS